MIQQKITGTKLKRVVNHQGQVEEIELDAKRGNYVVLISFNAAFNEISTAELCEFSKALDLFREQNADLIGCCRESSYSVLDWISDVKAKNPGLKR